jgi:hypothetical protein
MRYVYFLLLLSAVALGEGAKLGQRCASNNECPQRANCINGHCRCINGFKQQAGQCVVPRAKAH